MQTFLNSLFVWVFMTSWSCYESFPFPWYFLFEEIIIFIAESNKTVP